MRIETDQNLAHRFEPTQLKSLDELPDKTFRQIVESNLSFLQSRYQQIENYQGNPVNNTYAEVVVRGQVVATIDNNGYLSTSNAFHAQHQLLAAAGLNPPGVAKGPELARARAEMIAQLSGGYIRKSEDAMDQADYEAAVKPSLSVNTEMMMQDPLFLNMMKFEKAREIFASRQTG
ncbi:hypothetical protein [Oceanospirillum sanctuarii]|uniref:hypothetical protein n=1 Tax=Oceanospirillum sanctuarii TaxID=1434821 RepID=UPI000A3B2D40|nr:hypothetical protein [Oceanospirillum sanctuarii]